jgi:hypothetical protein
MPGAGRPAAVHIVRLGVGTAVDRPLLQAMQITGGRGGVTVTGRTP